MENMIKTIKISQLFGDKDIEWNLKNVVLDGDEYTVRMERGQVLEFTETI